MSPLRCLLWLGLILMTASGCQSIPFFSGMNYPVADARHPVMEILCVWEPAEGRGLDNLPCRGFGGQVLFFSSGRKEPVKVEGDVRVYVFDEEGVDGDPSKPLHQFDFPAAAWNSLLRPSNLGASYQIFIPYTRKGVHPANCSIRVRFTPEGGLPVYSRFATVHLVGHDSQFRRREKADSEKIITISHNEEAAEGQGIVTADWTEIAHGGSSSGVGFPESRFPSIPVGDVSAGARQTQMLNQLRQAAQQANESTSVIDQTTHEAVAASGEPQRLDARAISAGEKLPRQISAESPESSGSPAPRPTVRRHPLSD